jgi:hypothetical protein
MFGLVRFGLTKPTFSSANIIVLNYTWKLTRQKMRTNAPFGLWVVERTASA